MGQHRLEWIAYRISMSVALRDRLKRVCAAEKVPVAKFVRDAIERHLAIFAEHKRMEALPETIDDPGQCLPPDC